MSDSVEEDCRGSDCDIAIVGGGCSGSLVAVQLLRSSFPGRLAIIETRSRLGHGLAYSTPFEQHLLNVPAVHMSALPSEPAHFLDWLRENDWPGAAPDLFAPRKLYGEYLEYLLQQEVRRRGAAQFRKICAEAVDIRPLAKGVEVAFHDGSALRAGRVVLALGNPASSSASAGISGIGEWGHVSPWIGDALRVGFSGERILLIGTGLTAIDAALALLAQSPACEVYALSRRGLLPQVHDLRRAPAPPPEFEERGNLRAMFRQLRSRIQSLREADGCWRSAVDALRPVSDQIWQELPLADQRRFLRHLRTYWETHRHRMAPQVRRRVDGYRERGSLRVIAGRIREATRKGNGVELTVAGRGGQECRLKVHRVINCSGIHENYHESPRPLIRSLVGSGLATANDLGIGFRTDSAGALVDANGRVSTTLFTLGPPRRGELFETTAVPEIRLQAEALARHLAATAL